MPPHPCETCHTTRALILRPKTRQKLCRACFLSAFESEVHSVITTHCLFHPGERIAIGASGGKDSAVLAAVLATLNARHGYGLTLELLSVDEGIAGYRDDSLACVRRSAVALGLELTVVGYRELYGWTMDEVVARVGKKGNCTYCGVFRRQALDRGAERMGVGHVVTGHNADDVAETVLMNLLRGDLPRLARATSIVTETPAGVKGGSRVKRSKPLKYAYEKEIVLYAHHRRLDYFSTECVYSPEAFRGSARALIKNLERVRPSAILDVVRSGEDMARCVPVEVTGESGREEDGVEAEEGGCGHANGRGSGGEMAEMEKRLKEGEKAGEMENEVEIKIAMPNGKATNGQRHDRHAETSQDVEDNVGKSGVLAQNTKPIRQANGKGSQGASLRKKLPAKQQLQQCERCGYMSSQAVCKACTLLEGLNRNLPKMQVEVKVETDS